MTNALKNPMLTDTRFSAAFANSGPTGAIHVPAGWQYLYESKGTVYTVERIVTSEQPHWITDTPPQAQPGSTFGAGTTLETTSGSGTGGFRQRVTLHGGQLYLARALVTVFANDDLPVGSIRVQTRLTHQSGVVTSSGGIISPEHFRHPIEILTPVMESVADGDILFDFVADMRHVRMPVKVVIHELALNAVVRDIGHVIRIEPLGTIPAPPQGMTTPRRLLPMPTSADPRCGCRPSLAALLTRKQKEPVSAPTISAEDWP